MTPTLEMEAARAAPVRDPAGALRKRHRANEGPIRVLLADDQPLFLRGLRRLIEDEPGIEVCGEASGCEETLERARRLAPDVVVLELFLNLEETTCLMRRLARGGTGPALVVLSRHEETAYAVPAFKAGARAYVMKHEEPRCVIDAIRKAHAGELRYSWEVGAQLLNRIPNKRGERRRNAGSALSPREFEVVTLIASGLGSAEIAARLGVSIKTVEAHRAHIKHKANLDNSAALIRYSMALTNEIPAIPI